MAGGIQSDDQNLSNSQLAFITNYYRSKLLKQDQDKGRFAAELYVQNLGKVTITKADKNECCVTDSCILRTELKVPRPLETYKGINITFVGRLNGSPFVKTYHNALPWNAAHKWTKNEPKWYYQNGYIYIVNPPTDMLTYVNIQGIFEKPEDAITFRTCDCVQNNEDCFDSLDYEYPLPQHHVDTIVKLVAETELRILTSIPIDTSNNSVTQLADLNQK